MPNQYLIEIEKQENNYCASVHKNKIPLYVSSHIHLFPDSQIKIKGNPYSLAQISEALIKYHKEDLNLAFDERGQLEIGRHLFREVLGGADAGTLRDISDEGSKAEIRIISNDEHICRLPWVLLADEKGNFLTSLGCSVSLSGSSVSEWADIELPPSPRMLIAAPQPSGVAGTDAESHLEKLEDMLSGADHLYYRGRHLNVAVTWEDFRFQVEQFRPHIIYYYGHGVGNTNATRLVFADGKNRKLKEVSIADFADCLRNAPGGPPLVAYLNCCLGDTGGLLGAGMKLRSFVPVVVTNRTKAKIAAAQAQASAFFESVLLEGLPPDEAMNEIRNNLGRLDLSYSDARWMTPVLHAGYGQWKANPPAKIDRLSHDPFWHLKLDRVLQFGHVYYLTAQMLQEQKPKSLAYVWYGGEGQGVDMFHNRLKVELREKLKDTLVYEIQPNWPMELKNPNRSFADMLAEAFDVASVEHIPARIRTQSRGRSGRQTLVYVRHEPLRSTKVVSLSRLKTYLEWWDCHFATLLPARAHALLGISFVVGNPKKFHSSLVEKTRINDLHLNDTVFQLLEEMDRLAKKDLLDFLKAHNVRIPNSHKDRVLDQILAETGGQYEMTLEALKDVVDRAWDLSEDVGEGEMGEDEEEAFGVDDRE